MRLCVNLMVRLAVGGLLNPAGYSGLESYRALVPQASPSLSLLLLFILAYTFMHTDIAAETPSRFSSGVEFDVASQLYLETTKPREKSDTFEDQGETS